MSFNHKLLKMVPSGFFRSKQSCTSISLGVIQPRVVLSVGLGRLHFMQAIESIVENGVKIKVIQGWVPSRWWTNRSLDYLGRLVRSRKLSVGMTRRRLDFLAPEQNVGLALPEFVAQFLFALNRRFGFSRGVAALWGWTLFGYASKRYLDGNILHLRSGAGAGGVIAAAHKLGMKVIVDHSIAHPGYLEKALSQERVITSSGSWMTPNDPFWRQVLDDCLKADVLLVNSDFVMDTFTEFGFNPNRIAVRYLGVRSDFFRLKRNYALEGKKLQLLFTGQFGVRKGGLYLIKALELLHEKGISFELTAVGDASEAESLLGRSPVKCYVKLMGFIPQDELKTYLENADIYIFPSLVEGCASSAMEALAAGLPVIATRETGLPATHGAEAFIVPSRDSDAISNAVIQLAEDEQLRRRLGTNAAEMISSRYSWVDYGRNVSALYHELLGAV